MLYERHLYFSMRPLTLSAMSETGSANRHKNREEGREELSAEEKERKLLVKIDQYIDRCRDLCRHELISHATRSSYESMLQELRNDTSNDNRLKYVKENVGFLQKTIAKAEAEEARMLAKLQQEKKGAFSDADIQEMTAWFRNDSMVEMERSRELDEKVAEFIAKHEKIARRRNALMARVHALGNDDVEGISVLRDDEAFFSLNASARNSLLARLEGMDLAALSGKKQLFAETRAMLDGASTGDGRYLHAGTTGHMLKQMMSARKPEEYRGSVLIPSLGRYQDTRQSFDALCNDLSAAETMPISLPSLDAFLQWDTGKRSSFVAEGRRRLESQRTEEQERDEDLQLAKLRGERLVKAERWEAAEAFLEGALATYPDDANLQVMLAYVQEHGSETDEEREDRVSDELREEISALLAAAPPSVRGLYAAAAIRGADAFQLFSQSVTQGAHDTQNEARAGGREEEAEDDEEPERDEEHEDVEIADETDTLEEREEVLETITERTTHEAPAALTLSAVTADAQASYRRRISEPLLQKLRALEERDETYGIAA